MEEGTSFAFTLGEGCVQYELNEEQRLEGMCRICASTDSILIPVFDANGQNKGIVDLINNHLPILVTPTDLLPVSICTTCFETLSRIHSLVEVCVTANEKMQQMLQDVIVGFSQLDSFEEANVVVADTSMTEIESVEFPSGSEKEGKEEQQTPLIQTQEETIITSESQVQIESNSKEKKLYRCLYCDVTDSDTYSLLLHQIKSHPGKLLKCNECDFVYSADQRSKFNEHLKLHASAGKDTCETEALMETNLLIEENAIGEHVVQENKLEDTKESKENTRVVEKTPMRKKSHPHKNASNIVVKHRVKKEIHWRCGFCGMRAKSRVGLIDHCNLRHKERLGLSFLNSSSLECTRCKETFESEVWLKDHLCHSIFLPKTMPSPKQLSCLTCPEVFSDVMQFREHLLSHTNSVKCHICGAHFRSQEHLQPHLDKHKKNQKQSWQCPHCPRVFKIKSRLKLHLRTHTGERPYMCVKCGKQFSTDGGFRFHMAAHEGKRPYICSQCGSTFNRPSNLRRHENACGEAKLQCRLCKETFTSREEMLCHRAMHSKEEKDAEQSQISNDSTTKGDRFSCKVCGMKFDRVVELSQHRQESHTAVEIEEARKAGHADGGAFVCPDCGKEVYNKKNYERHMLLHSGNTQYQCKECSNVYSTKFALEYHMYTHTGERPFKCDLCPEGFKTRISLRVHHMKHTGEKPYKCRICSMGFMTAASLRLHLVTHSDSRMFSCNYCTATFKRKKTLVTHVRIHTGEKPYSCKVCGRRFTQKGSCSQHEKTHTRLADRFASDMHVTVDEVIESFPEDEGGRIDILVSQDESSPSQSEEVQHMVLIQQDVDCVIGEPDLMVGILRGSEVKCRIICRIIVSLMKHLWQFTGNK
ncbi:hypothetical protein ONE63_001484 [Megalurothrips usitatus]|uniref:Uncharacterized protein n=1 Tax=Megalurothrips usitatus TaxID=439358 RepID=A0AAV7XJK1_9NEOP|nr:hypothetical protein ONE63_001484 [Megalurothrips usitatus]